jgi:hypothetical protein
MRARAVATVLAVGLLAAAPSALARGHSRTTNVRLAASGSLTVVWHGDRAGGCAAAGLCGYGGSISYGRMSEAFLDLFTRAGSAPEVFADAGMDDRTVVRVRREVAGGPPVVCVDSSEPAFFNIDVERAYAGRYRLSLVPDVIPLPTGSGQCAGPRLEDFTGSLPSTVFKLPRLERVGTKLSLAGRFPFTAGPLRGEVISTLALRTKHASGHDIPDVRPPRGRSHTRVLEVDMRYEVARAAGEVAADFRAVDAPICSVLDACGASGRQTYTVASTRGVLEATGYAPAPKHGVPTLKAALRTVLRRGYLSGEGRLARGSGETNNVLFRGGGETCRDRLLPAGPPLTVYAEGGVLSLILGTDDPDLASVPNVLRGRCPGPTQDQVLAGGAPLASRNLPARALGGRSIHATLAGAGRFAAGAYRGRRAARVELDLVRTSARVRVVSDSG